MATESCTTTSLDYRELEGYVPEFELENNNEHLPVDRWEVHSSNESEWTRQA